MYSSRFDEDAQPKGVTLASIDETDPPTNARRRRQCQPMVPSLGRRASAPVATVTPFVDVDAAAE